MFCIKTTYLMLKSLQNNNGKYDKFICRIMYSICYVLYILCIVSLQISNTMTVYDHGNIPANGHRYLQTIKKKEKATRYT